MKSGAPEHPPAPQADPANPSTPASQTLPQGLRSEGASVPAPSAGADPFQATAAFLSHQRGGNVPAFNSAEARAERDRFAALLQAAARSDAQASQPAASQDTATTPQPATAPFQSGPGLSLFEAWNSAEARAERDRMAAALQAAARANAQASQPVASEQSAAVTPQQQPEQAQEATPADAVGPLSQSAALEEAAGGSSDAQAMSEGEPGGSPLTPQTAEGAASEPEAMSEGESRGAGAPETEPMQTPELAQQHNPRAVDQGEPPGQPSAPSCTAEAAGPSAAPQAPAPMYSSSQQQPQQQQRPQRSRAAPAQAMPAAEAPPPPPPEDSSVRRGAVNQPHRASRHAHPKPLEAAVLTISDAVLCSEMGVHFSPCGRLLAACVACQVSSSHHCTTWHLCGSAQWFCLGSRCSSLRSQLLHTLHARN